MNDRISDEEAPGVPEFVRAAMYQVQGGKWYLPAAARIMWFREDEDAADWGVETYLMEGGQEAGFCTVQATIRNTEGRIIAQGLKTETKQDFPAGWVEKAETGAISRALSIAGWGTAFALKELEEGNVSDSPQNGREAPSQPRTAAQPANRGQRSSTADQAVERGHLAPDGRSSGPNSPSQQSKAPTSMGLWGGPGQCPKCHAPPNKRHGKECLPAGR